MPRRPRHAAWKWSDSILWSIAALLGAGILFVYLERRDIDAHNRQQLVILGQRAQRAADGIAGEIQRTFEAPVFESLATVNHPLLRLGRFDLVARQFADGLEAYPQIERFFIWHQLTDGAAPGEALFFGEHGTVGVDHTVSATRQRSSLPLEGFYRDPPLGRLILQLAREQARSQRIYGAAERRVGASSYDLFVQIFWIDANRDRFFAVMGYVVSHQAVRRGLFGELYRRRLAPLLEAASDGGPPFELRILDEQGRLAFGAPGPQPVTAGRAPFVLRFYPSDQIGARMAGEVRERIWYAVVSPTSGPLLRGGGRNYWLSAASFLLMMLALGLAVRGRRRAAQLSRMQSEFVAHVSHQLKTPLSLLSAVTETLDLERVRSPQKLAEYVRMIRSDTEQLRQLVERILEFSRVENRRAYEFEQVDLVQLARDTVQAFDGALPGRDIRVDATRDAVVISGDPAAMEQLLANLLDNAIKYSPAGKPITVTIGSVGREATIEVRDQGIGISSEERRRIFDRFYRGCGATLHRQGFGLGLAIVQEIVVAHRGRIDVESAPGQETVFRVRLPLHVRRSEG